ncbi:hypothetical protein NECAME_11132 [Necator americanus]|uniref:Cystatin domain-containing protein n=1 Tax=Necator americanus TaxID=51031 RepID=W2T645_NECAM|nr:hypothetical protein NECAME_11132 [Necator americanus]ETN77348.1 hypothetical protein NECAME_11132 [Necator americanus]
MLALAVLISFFATVYAVPAPAIGTARGGWVVENPADDKFLIHLAEVLIVNILHCPDVDLEKKTFQGMAWDAAAGVVNEYRNGRFMVPKKVLEAKTMKTNGVKTDMVVLFQESWCSPQDGNSLADICESMCPLYQGGAQTKYRINAYQDMRGESTVYATKLEDVKQHRKRSIYHH